ncbi:MAG: ABC transporter substrate-binding protein [Candidatus Cloacimonetes bacterium]|nr:ABC transporter substrate-binding protein [Candidatus Cloacimonadota bacterium]
MKKFYVLFAFLIIGILGIIVYLSYFITFNKGYKSDIKVKEDTQQVSNSNPEDVITIGLFISTTGINAFSDANSYEGAMLSEDYINDNGGLLGKKIKVKIYDNQSTAIGAKQAAQRAVADNIVAAVGANRSTQTLAIAPVLQEAGIPLITPFSTVDRITEIGDYIFRVCYNDSFQGKTLAKYSLEELKLNTAVILSQIDE